MTKSVEAQLEL